MMAEVKETTHAEYRTFDLKGVSAEELQVLADALRQSVHNGEWLTRVAGSLRQKLLAALHQ